MQELFPEYFSNSSNKNIWCSENMKYLGRAEQVLQQELCEIARLDTECRSEKGVPLITTGKMY